MSRLRAAVATVAAGLALLMACSGGGSDESAPTTTVAPPPPVETTLPPCAEAISAEPLAPPATGFDPYVVLGARQQPGPDMATTTIPETAVSQVVQVPPPPYDPLLGDPTAIEAQAQIPDGCSPPLWADDP